MYINCAFDIADLRKIYDLGVQYIARMSALKLQFEKFLEFWGPPIVWAIVIFSFSSRTFAPVSQVYWQDFIAHKIVHVIEYMILSLLLFRGFLNSGQTRKKSFVASLVFSFAYGMTDELHQSLTPGRDPQLRDVLIDGMAATLGLWVVAYRLPFAPHKIQGFAKRIQIL